MNFEKLESQIESSEVHDKSIIEKANAKIAAKDEERRTDEAAKHLLSMDYKTKFDVIDIRKTRAVEKAKTECIKAISALSDKYTSGSISIPEQRAEIRKAEDIRDKAIRDAEVKYQEELEALKRANPEGWNAFRYGGY